MTQPNTPSSLDKLVQTVQKSSKYRYVSPALIQRIGMQALQTQRNFREAVKATKNKLHQAGGAYVDGKLNYKQGVAQLQETATTDEFSHTCRQLMMWHASTRERVPILDTFFQTTLAHLTDINSVIDIACGLNPLAWPWMPFTNQTVYIAYDIYADMLNFVTDFMAIAGIKGRAEVRDVVSQPPTQHVDLILLLKTLPCLAQIDKTAVAHLLDNLQADYILISYPVYSLGGRRKGMTDTYTAQFEALATARGWRATRFLFETELAFLVDNR